MPDTESFMLQVGDKIQVIDTTGLEQALAGEVVGEGGIYWLVSYPDRPDLDAQFHGRDMFYKGSGWRAWDGDVRWRLEPYPDLPDGEDDK